MSYSVPLLLPLLVHTQWYVQYYCQFTLLRLHQMAVLVVNKRNVMRKFKTHTQLWQILIQAKMWPIKNRKQTAAHKVAKSYPLYLAVRMRRYVSLININPSSLHKPLFAIAKKRSNGTQGKVVKGGPVKNPHRRKSRMSRRIFLA